MPQEAPQVVPPSSQPSCCCEFDSSSSSAADDSSQQSSAAAHSAAASESTTDAAAASFGAKNESSIRSATSAGRPRRYRGSVSVIQEYAGTVVPTATKIAGGGWRRKEAVASV